MRHRKREFKVGRRSDHVRSMLANQVCSLITEEQIQTTVVKAKETRRLAEKMITLGKKGTLHHRREAISKLRDKDAVAKLFADVAPRYMDREGGYTRIIRLGTRRGDAAEVCILQWVDDSAPAKSAKKKAKKEEAPAEAAAEEVEAVAEKATTETDAEEAPAEEAAEAPAEEKEAKE
jgi:large subunit ribosomal protein L17